MREAILTVVTDHYLSSGDFNGLPARVLIKQLGAECRPILEADSRGAAEPQLRKLPS